MNFLRILLRIDVKGIRRENLPFTKIINIYLETKKEYFTSGNIHARNIYLIIEAEEIQPFQLLFSVNKEICCNLFILFPSFSLTFMQITRWLLSLASCGVKSF